jgi:zinc-ribbon domain
MFCTGCGATLKPGVKFCTSCGKPVEPASLSPDATPAPSDALADTVVENAPVSPIAPPSASAESSQPPLLPATSPQAETQIHTGVEPAAPAYQAPPAPARLPPVIAPSRPATASGGKGNNKGVLLICVAVLGLAFGGLAYWFLLRKPAMNGGPSSSSGSRITATAPNKPSALESTPNNAAAPQSPAQPPDPNATEPKKEDAGGTSPAAATVPANSSGASAGTPASAPGPSLSGKWHGEYTNHDANAVMKVALQIAEDNSPDRLTGTLTFDAEGSSSASCAITGVYNPQSKFMLLNIGNCQGNPPAYFFEGKIGFSSVEVTARQVFGVDLAHNSLLNISRQ